MSTQALHSAAHATTLRVLAHLLDYPDAALREHLPDLRAALHGQRTLSAARLAELDALIDQLLHATGFDAEAAYVDLFDRGRGTALHLFEHVHGDSRDRGPAMIDLIKTYEEAGLYLASGELPDHLTVVLEYASTQPPLAAADFLREIAHILRSIFSALTRRESAYACVLAALLDLAGEPTKLVEVAAEPLLDETWSEPAAFGGCSSEGQRSPGESQPVRIVRTPRQPEHGQPGQPGQSAHGAST
ncbi:nitrate reductase delta subunit [Paraburkholderia terricola]|jgi:nitrate reductase delta subunit|uniref:nitrate reductase molybdenum cofactor assembly chaperone n=1 Tax=Paraburkholderia terricola TaxID=169427 RepID=UPI00285643F0|nr:nitrate reductase molybdenum cofactor assembly chaperone [Paraburkholderia terricola]MDR6448816.1 nitrate reductase delta subunit [Paraburkholderia terricola]